MALLNAMLEMIGDGRYSRIVTWPSHYPSKASISGCPENAFGWFDLDQWYLEGKTVRLTGPAAAHRIRQPECSGKPAGRVQQRGEGAGLRILQRGADRPARDRAEQMGLPHSLR